MRSKILLMLALAAAPSAVMAQAWQEFPFPAAGFKVQLPSRPAEADSTLAAPGGRSLPLRTFTLNDGAVSYRVDVVDYAKTDVKPAEVVADAEKQLVAGGSVTSSTSAMINRETGRELSVSWPDGARSIAALFFVNNHLYQLVGKSSPPNAADRTSNLVRFQQSLEFIDASGEPIARGGGRRGEGPQGGPRNGEAFNACQGKSVGDKVQLQTPEGDVAATCVLAARPDRPPGERQGQGQGQGGGGGGGRNRRPGPGGNNDNR